MKHHAVSSSEGWTESALREVRERAQRHAQHQGLSLDDAQDCAGDFVCGLLELDRRSPQVAHRLHHPAYLRVSLNHFVTRWRRRYLERRALCLLSESLLEDLPADRAGDTCPLVAVLRQEAAQQVRQSLGVLSPGVRSLLLRRAGEPVARTTPHGDAPLTEAQRMGLTRGRRRVQEQLGRWGWSEGDLRRWI